MRPPTDFECGYLCALACIWHGHGSLRMIDEALAALGKVDELDLVEVFDREMVEEWLANKKANSSSVSRAP